MDPYVAEMRFDMAHMRGCTALRAEHVIGPEIAIGAYEDALGLYKRFMSYVEDCNEPEKICDLRKAATESVVFFRDRIDQLRRRV